MTCQTGKLNVPTNIPMSVLGEGLIFIWSSEGGERENNPQPLLRTGKVLSSTAVL